MNPLDMLQAYLSKIGTDFGAGFNNMAKGQAQAFKPVGRAIGNAVARPIGYGVGKAYGLDDKAMNEAYYNEISKGLVSDSDPIGDVYSNFINPIDQAGIAKGDPWAVGGAAAAVLPYGGGLVRGGRTAVKTAGKAGAKAKAALKSFKPAGKPTAGASAGKKVASNVDRNRGKYYLGGQAGAVGGSMMFPVEESGR
jgi:hypothetical protein